MTAQLKTYKVWKESINERLEVTKAFAGYTKAVSTRQAENFVRARYGLPSRVTVESHGENGVTTTIFKAEQVKEVKVNGQDAIQD